MEVKRRYRIRNNREVDYTPEYKTSKSLLIYVGTDNNFRKKIFMSSIRPTMNCGDYHVFIRICLFRKLKPNKR